MQYYRERRGKMVDFVDAMVNYYMMRKVNNMFFIKVIEYMQKVMPTLSVEEIRDSVLFLLENLDSHLSKVETKFGLIIRLSDRTLRDDMVKKLEEILA